MKKLKLAMARRDGGPVVKKKMLFKKTLDGSFLFSSARTQRTVYPDGSLIGTRAVALAAEGALALRGEVRADRPRRAVSPRPVPPAGQAPGTAT